MRVSHPLSTLVLIGRNAVHIYLNGEQKHCDDRADELLGQKKIFEKLCEQIERE
jgi:hypothetical protein